MLRRAIVVRALAAVAALASAAPVRADAPRSTDAARSAARAKLVEGVDALGRGEPQRALEKFREAYALVPSPKIHYDFGLAYLGLGRQAEALSAFERFLAEAPDAPADKREKAAQRATTLRQQVGAATVTVQDAPDGATIIVDGREVGRAPLSQPVYLNPGRHEIAVRLPGGEAGPVQQSDVQAGGSFDVVLRVQSARSTATAAAPDGVRQLAGAAPPAPQPDGRAPPVLAADAAATGAAPADGSAHARRIAAISIGAAGVALIGAGLTFGALARSESDSLSRDSASGAQPGMSPPPFDPEKEARGTRYETLQVIGLAAGAVGLAAGVVLYATSRGRVTVEPGAPRALAGASVQVRF